MSRESRHLKVTGFADNCSEDVLLDHFNNYGRVQRVEFMRDCDSKSAIVSFMDLRTAAIVMNVSVHDIKGQQIKATYFEPPAASAIQIDSSASKDSKSRHALESKVRKLKKVSRAPSRNSSNGNASCSRSQSRSRSRTKSRSLSRNRSRTRSISPSHERRSAEDRASSSYRQRQAISGSGDDARRSSPSSRDRRSAAALATSRQDSRLASGVAAVSTSRGNADEKSRTSAAPSTSSSSSRHSSVIMVRNLPLRSTDSSLKDGLFFTYKKYGKVVSVKVVGEAADRYAVVTFRRYYGNTDIQKAIDSSNGIMFFGSKISVEKAPANLNVDDNERRPLEKDIDQFHPKSSRTLYAGNLENRVTTDQLRHIFERFGDVVDVDIKNRETPAPFAFIQFTDIFSVVKTIHAMEQDGYIGNNKVKVGFGKPLPSPMVWMAELPEHVSSEYLSRKMNFYGEITDIIIDKILHQALITYDCIESAQSAVQDMKSRTVCNHKVQIDYCSRELHDLFVDRMFRTNQLRGRDAAVYLTAADAVLAAAQVNVSPPIIDAASADYFSKESYCGNNSSKAYQGNKRNTSDSKRSSRETTLDDRHSFIINNYDGSRESSSRRSHRGRSATPPDRRPVGRNNDSHQNNRKSSLRDSSGRRVVLSPTTFRSSTSATSIQRRRRNSLSPSSRRRLADNAGRRSRRVVACVDRSSDSERQRRRRRSVDDDDEDDATVNNLQEDDSTDITSCRFRDASDERCRSPPSAMVRRRRDRRTAVADDGRHRRSDNATIVVDDKYGNADDDDDTAAATSSPTSASTITSSSDDDDAGDSTATATSASAAAVAAQSRLRRKDETVATPPRPPPTSTTAVAPPLISSTATLLGVPQSPLPKPAIRIAENATKLANLFGTGAPSTRSPFSYDVISMQTAPRKNAVTFPGVEQVSPEPTSKKVDSTSAELNFDAPISANNSGGNFQDNMNKLQKERAQLLHMLECLNNKGDTKIAKKHDDVTNRTNDVSKVAASNNAALKLGSAASSSSSATPRGRPGISTSTSASSAPSALRLSDVFDISWAAPRVTSSVVSEKSSRDRSSRVSTNPCLSAKPEMSSTESVDSGVKSPRFDTKTPTTPAAPSLSTKTSASSAAPGCAHTKSRRIPLDAVADADPDPLSDPRMNPPDIILQVDLPLPLFATKKHSGAVAQRTGSPNKSSTAFKSEFVLAQGIPTTPTICVIQSTLPGGCASSGSDESPLRSNTFCSALDATGSAPLNSVLMSPPTYQHHVTTDIFGESLSPTLAPSSAGVDSSRASFEERIRALDDKFVELDRMIRVTKERPVHRSGVDYSKYKVVKKPASSTAQPAGSSASCSADSQPTLSTNKSSVFDQDAERLSAIEEKYSSIPYMTNLPKVKLEESVICSRALSISIPSASSAHVPVLESPSVVGSSDLASVQLLQPGQIKPQLTPISPQNPTPQGILKRRSSGSVGQRTPCTASASTASNPPCNQPQAPESTNQQPTNEPSVSNPPSSFAADSRIRSDPRIARRDSTTSLSLKGDNSDDTAINLKHVSSSSSMPVLNRRESTKNSETSNQPLASVDFPVANSSISTQQLSASSFDKQNRSSSTSASATVSTAQSSASVKKVDSARSCSLSGPSTSSSIVPGSTPSVSEKSMSNRKASLDSSKHSSTSNKHQKNEKPSSAKHSSSTVRTYCSANVTNTLLTSQDKLSQGEQPLTLNQTVTKEWRNKELDDLFSGNKTCHSSVNVTKVAQLPKIMKKSNVGQSTSRREGVERKKSITSDKDTKNKDIKPKTVATAQSSSKSDERKHKSSKKKDEKDSVEKVKKVTDKSSHDKKKLGKKPDSLSITEAKSGKSSSTVGKKSKNLAKPSKPSKRRTTSESVGETDGSASGSDENESGSDSDSDSESADDRKVAKNWEKQWRKTLKAFGEPAGLSMYDRVKRRSSAANQQTPKKDVESTKNVGKSKFDIFRERLREKNAGASKKTRRVRCSDSSSSYSDDDDNADAAGSRRTAVTDSSTSASDDDERRRVKRVDSDVTKISKKQKLGSGKTASMVKSRSRTAAVSAASTTDQSESSDEDVADKRRKTNESLKTTKRDDHSKQLKQSKKAALHHQPAAKKRLKTRSDSKSGDNDESVINKSGLDKKTKARSAVELELCKSTNKKQKLGDEKSSKKSKVSDNRLKMPSSKRQKLESESSSISTDKLRENPRMKENSNDGDKNDKSSSIDEKILIEREKVEKEGEKHEGVEQKHAIKTKAAKKQVVDENSALMTISSAVDGGAAVATPLLTKAAKKALDFESGEQQLVAMHNSTEDESIADESAAALEAELAAGAIQSLDNEPISADIVAALKRSIIEGDDDETPSTSSVLVASYVTPSSSDAVFDQTTEFEAALELSVHEVVVFNDDATTEMPSAPPTPAPCVVLTADVDDDDDYKRVATTTTAVASPLRSDRDADAIGVEAEPAATDQIATCEKTAEIIDHALLDKDAEATTAAAALEQHEAIDFTETACEPNSRGTLTPSPAHQPLTIKIDESLDLATHPEFASQQSNGSGGSHVDEVIDGVVHGYVEIDPEKLIQMSVNKQLCNADERTTCDKSNAESLMIMGPCAEIKMNRSDENAAIGVNNVAAYSNNNNNEASIAQQVSSDAKSSAEQDLAAVQQITQQMKQEILQQQQQRTLQSHYAFSQQQFPFAHKQEPTSSNGIHATNLYASNQNTFFSCGQQVQKTSTSGQPQAQQQQQQQGAGQHPQTPPTQQLSQQQKQLNFLASSTPVSAVNLHYAASSNQQAACGAATLPGNQKNATTLSMPQQQQQHLINRPLYSANQGFPSVAYLPPTSQYAATLYDAQKQQPQPQQFSQQQQQQQTACWIANNFLGASVPRFVPTGLNQIEIQQQQQQHQQQQLQQQQLKLQQQQEIKLREQQQQQRFLLEQQQTRMALQAQQQSQQQQSQAAFLTQQQQQQRSINNQRQTQSQNQQQSAEAAAFMSHRSLLERYPVIWQGYLALKNDNALVQMHLVSGNPQLLPHSLPLANEHSSIPVLRIMQRMRLETQQLDGVSRRMQLREEHCILVVLPCGQDRNHIIEQSAILNTAFITYLQQKQAAGIVHIIQPGSTQPAYIVHVFPPCDFAQQALMNTACDFFQSIIERQTSFLFVVVTTAQST